MIRQLLQSLRLRFGLRVRTCARRNRQPYGPRSAFKVVSDDGIPMIVPRVAR